MDASLQMNCFPVRRIALNDAHIPQHAVAEPEEVKKVVVKVPVGRDKRYAICL